MAKKTIKQKFESFTYNHIWMRYVMDWSSAFLMSVLSAFIFAFGITTFMNPNIITSTGGETIKLVTIVSGGSSGIAQTITSLVSLFGFEMPHWMPSLYSILYVLINIPLIVIAFKGIGVRFGTFTLVNVGFVFIFTYLFNNVPVFSNFLSNIAAFFQSNGGLFSRAFFAGICTGLSSAIAYKYETSAGGFDIIAYYLALRKNTSVGKIGVIINGIIITAFSIIHAFSGETYTIELKSGFNVTLDSIQMSVVLAFFAIIYLVMVMILVDLINTRNKKVQVQIITSKQDMAKFLIANIPHGATIVKGKGAYSGDDRYIVYMIVSSSELKHVIEIVKEIDPTSFLAVTSLAQVSGRFYMKPVK